MLLFPFFSLWRAVHENLSWSEVDISFKGLRIPALKRDPVCLAVVCLSGRWKNMKASQSFFFLFLSPLIDTFNFKGAVTAAYFGPGVAIKGQAVRGFQIKEFINMVGNKGRLSVEYWLRVRSDWSNWWGFVGRNVGGATLVMAIRLH